MQHSSLSKTQVDRLGDRLKTGTITDDDLRILEEYRRSFADAYEFVAAAIRDQLSLEPTGRQSKSTPSIVDKLKRESIRLSQIQDIAGCRLVVKNIVEQDSVVKSLAELFEKVVVVDRRENSSHGYRAVHVVLSSGGKSVEIQVRTLLQHLWAELSEKFSDRFGIALKYGGGNPNLLQVLTALSEVVSAIEALEVRIRISPTDHPAREKYAAVKGAWEGGLRKLVESTKKESNDISD